MKFMQKVLGRASKIRVRGNALLGDAGEVKEGERVVGILPQELRGLYAVLCADGDKLQKLMDKRKKKVANQIEAADKKKSVAAIFGALTDGIKGAVEEFSGPVKDLDTIREMFWMAVRRAFPGTEGKSVGLRKEWTVVTLKPKGLGDGAIEFPSGIAIPVSNLPAGLLNALSGLTGSCGCPECRKKG